MSRIPISPQAACRAGWPPNAAESTCFLPGRLAGSDSHVSVCLKQHWRYLSVRAHSPKETFRFRASNTDSCPSLICYTTWCFQKRVFAFLLCIAAQISSLLQVECLDRFGVSEVPVLSIWVEAGRFPGGAGVGCGVGLHPTVYGGGLCFPETT